MEHEYGRHATIMAELFASDFTNYMTRDIRNPTLALCRQFLTLRQFLREWALNTSGHYKKQRKGYLVIDELDMTAESRELSAKEIEVKNQSNAQIAKLLREEEIKWY